MTLALAALTPHGFTLKDLNNRIVVTINCHDLNRVDIKFSETIPVYRGTGMSVDKKEVCKLDFLLEFTLESQENKEGVTYKNGESSLTSPPIDKSLCEKIKEFFFKLLEWVLSRFCVKVEKEEVIIYMAHKLDDLKVENHFANMEPLTHNN
ncbi:MAG: hypothetical protein PV345_02365 [Wolbachia sp.]|nr:hypothetical protein [Wolbachia sp.]